MAITSITSQLIRYLLSLNRFKDVYLEEREIIGEPLFEGLPELRVRENSDGTYQVKIKGSDVSFILESLQHYFGELEFKSQIIYNSITLLKSMTLESIFFSDSEYMRFQEFVDYLEYDSNLEEFFEKMESEFILDMETMVLFTPNEIEVNLPHDVLLTSKIKNLASSTPWDGAKDLNNLDNRDEALDTSLTSTLDKLMSIERSMQPLAEHVLSTAWYELVPRTRNVIRFDPVVRKIPEILASFDEKDESIYLISPDVDDTNNKFITKILEFFDNSSYHLENVFYRFLLPNNAGLVALDASHLSSSRYLDQITSILEEGLRKVFGEIKRFKMRKYRLETGEKPRKKEDAVTRPSLRSFSAEKMPTPLKDSSLGNTRELLHSFNDTYPEEYYEIDLSALLNKINSSSVIDTPLSLEELEILLFINERKSKKVQSNIIIKKLGIKKEKAITLLKKLAEQGWFKVSHGWYSLRPSKATLLDGIVEEIRNLQYMASSGDTGVSIDVKRQQISNKRPPIESKSAKYKLEDLTPEEMKTLLLREKMEKEFNEDLDEFYDLTGSVEEISRNEQFPLGSDYDFEWENEWDQDLALASQRKTSMEEPFLDYDEYTLEQDESDELANLNRIKKHAVDVGIGNRPSRKNELRAVSSPKNFFIEDLSEEERFYLQKTRLDSLQREKFERSAALERDIVKSKKTPEKVISERKAPIASVPSEEKEDYGVKLSLNEHLDSLAIAGFTDEEIQVILALLNHKEDKMVFKSLVKHTTLKKTRLKKIVKDLVKKGVIRRLRGDYVTIDYESPNPNLKKVLDLKDWLNERKESVWNIELSEEELNIIKAMAKRKDFKAQSNSIANEIGLSKQKTKEILRKFAVAGICNVTRGWYALNEEIVRLVLGEKQWEAMKKQYQPPRQIPEPKIPLSDEERLVYEAIRSQKSLKAQSNLIARKTGLDREKIRKILRTLVEKDVLKVKHGWYCIVLPE